MATTKEFSEEVRGALGTTAVRVRPMFGEYGIYCDNKFFLRITAPGGAAAIGVDRRSPYPGAGPLSSATEDCAA
jgi:hypothetical protein